MPLRLLTFNLWHGLSPTSPLVFEPLEPVARRQLREQLQIETIRELKPDVCFFQEVNPSRERLQKFKADLGMAGYRQPDLVGLKIFGIGFPMNLNSALVTLAQSRVGLKFIKGVSLSRPGTHFVHTWGSYQLSEERFALFTEGLVPGWGRVLFVNTHLHHGLEATEKFLGDLQTLAEKLELEPTVLSEIKARLAEGHARRENELKVLLDEVAQLENRFEAVVLAGDFNASPESGKLESATAVSSSVSLNEMLRDAGFVDSWLQGPERTSPGYSFDPERNAANHILQARFPLTLVVEDLTFSQKNKEALMELARAQENRARRIDYIWIKTHNVKVQVKHSALAGLPNNEGLAPSDHFGVVADLEF